MSRKKHPSRMSIEEFRKGGFDPTRSRQPRRTGEHDNQSAYFKILDLNIRQHPELTFIFAIPNAAKRSPQVIREMLDEGLKKGVPDTVSRYRVTATVRPGSRTNLVITK